ncbi:MAG: radical SAM protein [Patescibacteria group bacterium]|nr:radical SAM protein [Patescibacteria group bacterium]
MAKVLKSILRKVLPAPVKEALSLGIDTLREYPQFLLGSGEAKAPRRVDLELTFACNARCQMCPLYGQHVGAGASRPVKPSRADELTTAELESILEQCGQLGVQHVTFTGGEPLVRNDLAHLVAHARSHGMRTGVISNGGLLTQPRAESLMAAGLNELHISLDGPQDIHDMVRRVPGLFAKVDANVLALRAMQQASGATEPLVTVGCTVSALNQECLAAMVPIASRWQAPLYFAPVFYCTPGQDDATHAMFPGEEAKPEDWKLPADLLRVDARLIANGLKAAHAAGRRLGVTVCSQMSGYRDIHKWFADPAYAHNNKCFYPWYATRVNPYGQVYPCSILTVMGDLRQQSLASIWNGDKYKEFRRRLRKAGLFPKCAKCCVLNRQDIVRRFLPRGW